MREILFRAKAINRNKGYHRTKYKNGDWVYGLITRLYDEQFENLSAEMTNEYGVIGIDIDHNTIGEFTGLIDKNGKKIFEGDIHERENHFFIVKYGKYRDCETNEDGYGWYFEYNHRKGCEGFDGTENEYVNIIGNIHDNPELLRTPQNDEVRE